MNRRPKLAIVGRPNVGKSALFNSICKKRHAIVDEAEGITRDRLYGHAEIFGFPFEIIDTGGIDPRSRALFNDAVKRQAEIAIEEADTIVMVVDAHIGVTTLDSELAAILLRTQKPLCLAINKVDHPKHADQAYVFDALGITRKVAVSAIQQLHIAELLETAFADFNTTTPEAEDEHERGISVAIVGRPNVGKSTLANTLINDERCIVSPIPGTTRDSIDLTLDHEGQRYTFIDTAGIRRKKAENEVVDKFAFVRTQEAISRADVCILMLDAQEGMTTQEKKIANMIEEEGKGCLLLLNKWDLVHGYRMEHCIKQIHDTVPFLQHCPILCLSALEGRNVSKLLTLTQEVYQHAHMRITTNVLNRFLEKAMQHTHPPMIKGKRLRIYYMAQVAVAPPQFVFFINHKDLLADSYKRYLYNQFRAAYTFSGVPLKFRFKSKAPRR